MFKNKKRFINNSFCIGCLIISIGGYLWLVLDKYKFDLQGIWTIIGLNVFISFISFIFCRKDRRKYITKTIIGFGGFFLSTFSGIILSDVFVLSKRLSEETVGNVETLDLRLIIPALFLLMPEMWLVYVIANNVSNKGEPESVTNNMGARRKNSEN